MIFNPKAARPLTALALVLSLACFANACSSGDADGSPAIEIDGVAAEIHPGECTAGSGEAVTVYSGRSEELIGPVLDAFTCKTGTEVNVRWGSSTDLALLLAEEGDNTPADVFLSRSPGPVGFLEAKGLLTQIDGSVLDLVANEYRSSADTWVGFSGRKRVLVYNTDLVAVDELPESVFDLTDPRWNGEVAIPGTNGSFLDWFTVLRDQFGNDVAAEWIDAMVANQARYYANNRSIVEAVSRGEVQVGLVNHYYNHQIEQSAPEGEHHAANYDFVGDDIGSALMITAAAITEASENPDPATSLVAFLLSEAVQQFLTTDTYEYPLAAGVEPAAGLPPLGGLEVGTIDFDTLGGGLEASTEIVEASGLLTS